MKQSYQLDAREVISYQGERYHLRIRTNNPAFPVLLFLHGGPGSTDRGLVLHHLSGLAQYCTMVCWDQRCAGLAYSRKEAKRTKLTMDLYIRDTCNVMCYLKERFHQERIILAGSSWGSLLGIYTALRHPEHVGAYVGSGQCINQEQEVQGYEFVLGEATRRRDKKALNTLRQIGPPVHGQYKEPRNVFKQRALLYRYGGASYQRYESQIQYTLRHARPMLKEYSPYELAAKYMQGNLYSVDSMDTEIHTMDVIRDASRLEVPVYLFEGHHDFLTPYPLAETWFEILDAPHKELVWFERSGHMPFTEEPEKFTRELIRVVKTHGRTTHAS